MAPEASRAKLIFLEALEIDAPGKRAAFLDEACADDAALRRGVEELLHHEADLGSFLEGRPMEVHAAPRERAGSRIGPYELIEEIGEGGFGVVYLAEQRAPVRRRVALKILKAGMCTREILTRFEAERQALALMQHPNIARVFDGGITPGGRPYFVMELVRGVPITEYCDQCRLPIRDRLELLIRVCRAVEHAHQRGIIHRDLKPSNILVSLEDGRPAPKVIDFGVAKATAQRLTDVTFHTRFAQMIGTPPYMSPEQAEMCVLDIDTRSDIYSLGVLLYELMTGTTPLTADRLRTATFDELCRIIRTETPPTPSTRLTRLNGQGADIAAARGVDLRRLVRLVHGDLDWIVMRAIEKDRTRRYGTATALAEDIERHLADEPVEAGPPSVFYRVGKFLRRHRTGVAFAALFLAGAAYVGWTLRDRALRGARLQRDVQRAFQSAVELREEAWGLTDRPARWEERLAAARFALDGAEARLDAAGRVDTDLVRRVRQLGVELAEDEQDRRLVERLERTFLEHGYRIEARSRPQRLAPIYGEALAEYGLDPARVTAEAAAARIRAMRPAVQDAVVDALQEMGLGAMQEPGPHARWSSEVLAAADPDPWRVEVRAARAGRDRKRLEALANRDATSLGARSTVFLASSLRLVGAHELGIHILKRAQSRDPASFLVNVNLAEHLIATGQPAQAETFLRVAAALRPEQASVRVKLAEVLADRGDREGARDAVSQAKALGPLSGGAWNNIATVYRVCGDSDAALGAALKAVALTPNRAMPWGNLGTIHFDRGDLAAAIDASRKAIAREESSLWLHNLAIQLRNAGQDEEALEMYVRASEAKPDHAQANADLGSLLLERGESERAVPYLRRALSIDPEQADAHTSLACLALARQDVKEALRECDAAIASRPTMPQAHHNRGLALVRMGEAEKARAAIEEAVRLDPNYANAHCSLGSVYLDLGDADKARDHFEKALAIREDFDLAHLLLGSLHQESGDLEKAFESWDRALALRPAFPNWPTWIAWRLATMADPRQRDAEAAVRYAGSAVKLAPDRADARQALGVALYRAGRFADAVTALTRASELEGGDGLPATWLFLAMAKHESGQQDARDSYERAVALCDRRAERDPELQSFREEADAMFQAAGR